MMIWKGCGRKHLWPHDPISAGTIGKLRKRCQDNLFRLRLKCRNFVTRSKSTSHVTTLYTREMEAVCSYETCLPVSPHGITVRKTNRECLFNRSADGRPYLGRYCPVFRSRYVWWQGTHLTRNQLHKEGRTRSCRFGGLMCSRKV